MKRLLQSILGFATVIGLALAVMWLVRAAPGRQPVTQTTSQQTADFATEVVTTSLEDSEHHLPKPTPQLNFDKLKVEKVEEIPGDPYQNVLWSFDGEKALVSKHYTQYLLARNENISSKDPVMIPGVYTGLGDLWLLDLATGAERQLTQQQSGRYTWSPDNTKVAYLAPTESEGIAGALYVLDIATRETKQVAEADFLGSDYTPQWLPTGEIVYVHNGDLRSIQADGANEKGFPNFKFFNGFSAKQRQDAVEASPDTPMSFHFSPTGRRVAYKTKKQPERAVGWRLWLADADGSKAQLITEQAEGSYYEWSPDGEWLVFNTFRDVDDKTVDEREPGVRGLWVIKADGSEVYPLYRIGDWHSIVSPVWSPDNSMVAFIDYRLVDKPDSFKGVARETSLQVAKIGGQEINTLIGPSNDPLKTPKQVWWSPNGQYFFTLRDGDTLGSYKSDRLMLTTK